MASLRDLRLEAGITQQELARRSGIAQPNIAAYERGRRVPSPPTRATLERALRPRPSRVLDAHRDKVVAVLRTYKMSSPRVFGSVADGNAHSGSDVDLLVDAEPDLDLLDIVDAASELEALLGVEVDIVTSRSLREDHEILRKSVPL